MAGRAGYDSEENFKKASEIAYNIISKKILDGEFTPGSKLSRRKMAEAAGVSVIPVIEALNRLEEDGLVESKPQWGSFVVIPTIEKIKEMYIIREAIECQIARVLAGNMTIAQENILQQIAHDMDNVEYYKESHEDYDKLHYDFHLMLAEYTGYKSLVDALRRVNLFWVLCKSGSLKKEKYPVPKHLHTKLIDEIKSGDPDRAEAIMRIHIYDSLEVILEKLEKP